MGQNENILDSHGYDFCSQALAIVFYSDLSEVRRLEFLKDFLPSLDIKNKNKFMIMCSENIGTIKYVNYFIKNNYIELLNYLCEENILSREKLFNIILDAEHPTLLSLLAPSLENKVSPMSLRDYCKNVIDYKYSSMSPNIQKELEKFIINNCSLNLLELAPEHMAGQVFNFHHSQDKEIALFKNLLEKIISNQKDNSLLPEVAKKFRQAFSNWTTKEEEENRDALTKRVNSIAYILLKKSSALSYANMFRLEDVINEKSFNLNDFPSFYNKFSSKAAEVMGLLDYAPYNNKIKNLNECLKWIETKIDEDREVFKNYNYTFRNLEFLVGLEGEKEINPIKLKIINKLKGFINLELNDVLKNFIFSSEYYNEKNSNIPVLLNFCLTNFLENKVLLPTYLKEILINKMPSSSSLIEVFFDKQNLTTALAPVSDALANSKSSIKI